MMAVVLWTVITTHITILCVTLYLHRGVAHRSVTFHPVLEHFMRCWLWLTTGMVTRQWVAVHRLHHRHTDRAADPHSPHVWGIWRVLCGGALLYNRAAADSKMVDAYGSGSPDDWIERTVYTPHHRLGILILLVLNVWLWGWVTGAVVWLIQMAWIPFWAAGVINGGGHWVGYRNGDTGDHSRNLLPWGVIVGGEELHNNHHLNPQSPKLSLRRWEWDWGWTVLCALRRLRLAQPKTTT